MKTHIQGPYFEKFASRVYKIVRKTLWKIKKKML